MGLNQYIYSKQILIDDAGWGDLILGVVIGALKLPENKYMERRIPVSSFQSPHFEEKRYLKEAVKIAEEIINVMQADKETSFKICKGYVLSSIRNTVRMKGFYVQEAEIIGELQEKVENSYMNWCEEVGFNLEKGKTQRNFWTFLNWIAEKPRLREKLVKTGWKSWKTKWKQKVYSKKLQ
jgi:hypothetical protein